MKSNAILSLFLAAAIVGCARCAVVDRQFKRLVTKVFNYQGDLMPIKDDRTGEIINGGSNNTQSSNDEETEAMCWNLIVERSVVTFALQNRVLDELEKEMKGLPVDDKLREVIEQMNKKLRSDMRDALEALKEESPENYFDALFATSEDIIKISSLIVAKDPALDDKLLMALVKAVSRLGRNNSSLIQDFIDQCSLIEKSPQPRAYFSRP